MSFELSTYKLIRSLTPLEVFDIITKGVCYDYLPKIIKEVSEVRGEWYLNKWNDKCVLDSLSIYISDGGFVLYTTKTEAIRLESIFKSFGLHDVHSDWYGGEDVWTVGFSYYHEDFRILYTEWLRNKKIDQIIENVE